MVAQRPLPAQDRPERCQCRGRRQQPSRRPASPLCLQLLDKQSAPAPVALFAGLDLLRAPLLHLGSGGVTRSPSKSRDGKRGILGLPPFAEQVCGKHCRGGREPPLPGQRRCAAKTLPSLRLHGPRRCAAKDLQSLRHSLADISRTALRTALTAARPHE